MTTGQIADALKDIADQLSTNGDGWDYQADRLYKIAAELTAGHEQCPKCGKRMTWTATAPIENAPMEWRCFECPVDLGSVGSELVIEISEDGHVSHPVKGPIREA